MSKIATRAAQVPGDIETVAALWRRQVTWIQDTLALRYGFRLGAIDIVDRDLADIAHYVEPAGHTVIALSRARAVGVDSLVRVGPATAEIRRMFVDEQHRRQGCGRAVVTHLLAAARADGYRTVLLDSPDFCAAAHALYRSVGFTDVPPFSESEIPRRYRGHWRFMALNL